MADKEITGLVPVHHSCSARLPQWRRGSSPIILFRKRRSARWNRSKPSGGFFTKRTPELHSTSCLCSHGPVDRLLVVKRNVAGPAPGRWLQHCKIALFQSLAIMRFPQVKHRANGNDASWINLRMRHVVMALDVIEIDSVCDAWLLI